ncbi:hypothetical protein TIFTF001_003052 [Ficus carica]|uniref:Uncharacterized protein n=1 Tax=Ficus carica TaxID=3494 RepID=A0AA88CUN9_FICCA|nr:hypothetical protein TIFTF001_003052 [Ficus carica]
MTVTITLPFGAQRPYWPHFQLGKDSDTICNDSCLPLAKNRTPFSGVTLGIASLTVAKSYGFGMICTNMYVYTVYGLYHQATPAGYTMKIYKGEDADANDRVFLGYGE